MKNLIILIVALNVTFCPSNIFGQTTNNFHEYMYNWYTENPVDTNENAPKRSGAEKHFDRTFKIWGERLHPHGDVSIAASAVIEYANQFASQAPPSSGTGSECDSYSATWEPMGPVGTPSGPSSARGNGQIHRLRFDPQYNGTTNKVLYACSQFGGLWKSENSADNWTILNTDNLPMTSVSDVAIDYSNSSNLFISTGYGDGGVDFNVGQNTGSVNPIFTIGIYRSTNGGNDWEPINQGFLQEFEDGGTTRQIKINPNNSEQLFVASTRGIFKTDNALDAQPQWAISNTGIDPNDEQLRGLEFKPNDSNTLYTSGLDIYKSTNSGTNWISMTGPGTGLDINGLTDFTVQRINIATTPDAPERLYAYLVGKTEIQPLTTRSSGYIYMFDGSDWNQLDYENDGGNPFIARSPTWTAIAVNPGNANQVYCGYTKVRGSNDIVNNSSFDVISNYLGGGFHADVHHLVFEPIIGSSRLFCGNHGGVSVKDLSNTGTGGWTYKNEGLQANIIWAFDYAKGFSDKIGLALQDCGTSLSQSGNGVLNYSTVFGGDGYGIQFPFPGKDLAFFKPGGSNTGSSVNADYFYRNYGNNNSETSLLPFDPYWEIQEGYTTEVFRRVPATFQSEIHPETGEVIFGFTELFQRKKEIPDSGDLPSDLWEFESDIGKTEHTTWRRAIIDFKISPANPDIIYLIDIVSGNNLDPSSGSFNPSSLYRSESGLNNGDFSVDRFEDITQNLQSAPSTEDPPIATAIEVSPTIALDAWLTFSGYDEDFRVLKSSDGGDTWVSADPNHTLPRLPVNDIVYQKGTNDRLYIATDVGVYYTEAGMDCWAKYGDVPNVRVVELDINYCSGKLIAATFGRGVWQVDVLPTTGEMPVTIISDPNVIWDSPNSLENNILILDGAKLTITSEIKMPKNGKILVEPGGQLVVNGGTLTNACGEFWEGIEVWGNYFQPQTTTYQGKLTMLNDATIENANVGVKAYKSVENGWADLDYGGGIIQARNSNFINNKQSVVMTAYQNTASNGNLIANRSYFDLCDFELDDDYLGGTTEANYSMVSLWRVDGVRFSGSEFLNTRDVSTSQERRSAIYTLDANFKVQGKCVTGALQIGVPCPAEDIEECIFDGFNVAILALGGTHNGAPSVKESIFRNNMVGIRFQAIENPSATFNKFEIGEHPYTPIDEGSANEHLGIKVLASSEYIVEENDFEKAGSNGWDTHGALIENTGGMSNELYLNEFTNLTGASIGVGNNVSSSGFEGLRFICNQNSGNDYDFELRKDGVLLSFASRYQQGATPGKAAGNTFSLAASDGLYNHFDFKSNGVYEYRYDANGNGEIPSDDESFVSDGDIVHTVAISGNACSTHYPINGKPDLNHHFSQYPTIKGEFNGLMYAYLQLIDEGNTDGMIDEIDLSWPTDAWDLHAELMARSPYNSESVLTSAIDKNILPHGLLLEILIANPDALRSGNVVAHIQCCMTNPLPQYMLDILALTARDVQTVRTEMERNLSALHLNMVRSHKQILHHHLHDTLVGANPDTLQHYYSGIKNLRGRYQEMFWYVENNDFTNVTAVLDTISLHYKLTANEGIEYTTTVDFVDLLEAVHIDGRTVATLDSTEIAEMQTISTTKDGGVAAVRAENILCFFYHICPQPPAIPKNNSTQARRPNTTLEELIANENKVTVSPNPADQYIQIEYDLLFSKPNAYIRVMDLNGRTIKTWDISETQIGLKLLDTRELAPGIYFYEITQGSESIKSDKFMVQH